MSRSRFSLDDPIVRRLVYAALGLLILYLVGIAAALYLGIIGSGTPYRTTAERDVGIARATFEAQPTEESVLEYVGALVAVGRYGTAQDVIDRSTDVQQPSGGITAAQANLSFVQMDYPAALEAATQAREIAQKTYDDTVKEGGPAAGAAVLPETYWAMALLQARSYEALEQWDEALDLYDEYLTAKPRASDVLVGRANVKLTLGDEAGAVADFKAALTYDPEYAPARDGLDKIGAGK